MLNIHPLYSSSSGNMFHIGTEKTNILLDVGVSYKAINEGLKQIDKSLMDISAVLITHEHVDHIKGLSLLCRKNNIPIYFSKDYLDDNVMYIYTEVKKSYVINKKNLSLDLVIDNNIIKEILYMNYKGDGKTFFGNNVILSNFCKGIF